VAQDQTPSVALATALLLSANHGFQMEASWVACYVVFTHLLSEGMDRLVAQHDGLPVEGRRPTTGWVQGEAIVDAHLLHWREEYVGTCPVEIGLYDPLSGERLPVYDRAGKRLPHDRLLLDRAVYSLPQNEH